jgi:hypothetical protein
MDTNDPIKQALIQKATELEQQGIEREEKRKDFMARMQKQYQIELMKVQHKCSHRKGDSWTVMAPDVNSPNFLTFQPKLPLFNFDFVVMLHTFVDGKQMIKCLMCNRKWVTGDLDFDEAMKMVRASTNKPSASERLINGAQSAVPENLVSYVAPLKKSFWKRFWTALIAPKKAVEGVEIRDEEIKGDKDV